jgi:hypothetical protein
VVVGTVDGADPADVGKTIDVTVSGDHAYTTSLMVPIILIGIGLFLAVVGVLVLIKGGRQNSGPGSPVARTNTRLDPSAREP